MGEFLGIYEGTFLPTTLQLHNVSFSKVGMLFVDSVYVVV